MARIVDQLRAWRAVGVIMEYREELAEVITGMGIKVVLPMADILMEGSGRSTWTTTRLDR